MIFINHMKSGKAAKDYYSQHIAPGDGKYYSQENATQLKGVWHGRGDEMLGLSGEVAQKDFFSLCDNRDPRTGKQLTARMDDDRRVLTDFTFDAPKAVSIAYEIGGDERIPGRFRKALRETMAEVEANARTRVRKNGRDENRTTGNMVWAEHVHRTTRPVNGVPDPHLHAHATVFNATFDRTENRWKAIQLGDIVRDKGYYQAAFHARLAAEMSDLGYAIKKDGRSFTIAGIDRATIEKFSRRTAVIEAEAARRGIDDAATKGKLGRRTREKKSVDPEPISDLRKEWNGRLTPEERVAIKTAGDGRASGDVRITPEQAKEYALEHSFQNASAVSERRLKAEALTYAVGSIKPEDVADIAQHPQAISKMHDGQLMVTTKTVLHDELAMLQFAKDGQRKQQPFVYISGGDVYKRGGFVSIPAQEHSSEKGSKSAESSHTGIPDELAGLSEEQKRAALHVLNSRDTVTGIVGKAGTGKTRMMRATVDAIEAGGHRVHVFAPSSQASRGVLKKEGFAQAETLAMLLKNEKLQEQTKGQVLWIDEAGLVSSKDMSSLMDVAKRNGNRVILSGDYTQHSSVEAGDAFRLLEKEAGVRLARLTEVRRQTEPGYRQAVEAISEGTGRAAQTGFDALDRMGYVIEATGPERHSFLIADYLKAQEDGKSALIIAPTHAEGDALSAELRGAMKQRGLLGKEQEFITRKSMGWTDAQKGDIRNYEPGMVIDFHQNAKGGFQRGESAVVLRRERVAKEALLRRESVDRGSRAPRASEGLVVLRRDGSEVTLPLEQAKRFDVFRTSKTAIARGDRIRITKNGEARVEGQAKGSRLNNGDIFTVEGFTKEGDIRLEKGKLLPKDWGHFTPGYVDTSYASQGKTVDRVFIATGNESIPATNQQQWYVSASRGREMAKVYVNSKQNVRDAIARTGKRLSAVELTHTRLRDSWRKRISQSMERNRITRFVRQRAQRIVEHWRSREGVAHA